MADAVVNAWYDPALAERLRLRWGCDVHTSAHAAALLHAWPALVVTSGARTARDNARVGGSPTSWHLKGRAFDFAHVNPTYLAHAASTAAAQRITPGCTGPEEVLLERHGDRYSTGLHLHVAW